MKASFIIASLSAVLVAATPVQKEARQASGFVPIQIGDSTTGQVVQADVPVNTDRMISSLFGALGDSVQANWAAIADGAPGACNIYADLAKNVLVAQLTSGANPGQRFERRPLSNGLISCPSD